MKKALFKVWTECLYREGKITKEKYVALLEAIEQIE